MKLLLATTNLGKLQELVRMLPADIEPIGLGEFQNIEPAIETGSSFAMNALIKARHYYSACRLPTIADDSGLEVEALAGAPGIYSSRYAGETATDSQRIEKLLAEMRGVPPSRRGARFVCAAAIVWKDGERVFGGEAGGMILHEPMGAGGFGYDPLFYYPPLGRTFAQLSAEEKDEVSHRGQAFRRLADWFLEMLREGVFA